jgi:putative SOS response-associated peptidase YedK
MCGRFVIKETEVLNALLRRLFSLAEGVASSPRYNIAPSQAVAVVTTRAGRARLAEMRWGLVPAHDQSEKPKLAPINARSEEAFDKAMFRDGIQRRRCVVPADAYYEWRKLSPTTKQPYCIALKSRTPFLFAGIYEPATPLRPETVALFTTESNGRLQDIHHRMPVILPLPALGAWLAEGAMSREDFWQACTAWPADELDAWPVSSLVNKPANDSPVCLEPVAVAPAPAPAEPELFDL